MADGGGLVGLELDLEYDLVQREAPRRPEVAVALQGRFARSEFWKNPHFLDFIKYKIYKISIYYIKRITQEVIVVAVVVLHRADGLVKQSSSIEQTRISQHIWDSFLNWLLGKI